MNERIQQLIAQAGGVGHDDDGNELTPALVGESLEQFAELIIQDIVNIMNDQKSYNRCTYTTFDLDKSRCVTSEIIKHINENFGTKL